MRSEFSSALKVAVFVALAGAGLTIGAPAEERAAKIEAKVENRPAAVVKYRENVMTSMRGHLGAISGVVKGDVTYKEQIEIHANGLNALAKLIPTLYPAGTGPDKVKTEAKAEVWKSWEKFKTSAKVLEDESAKLAAVAKSGNMDVIKAQFTNVGKACGNCHDVYRIKD